MGIGEQYPVRTGNEARALPLLLLNRGPAAKQAAQGVHHPLDGVDSHYGWPHLGHRINDQGVALLQRRRGGRITDRYLGALAAW